MYRSFLPLQRGSEADELQLTPADLQENDVVVGRFRVWRRATISNLWAAAHGAPEAEDARRHCSAEGVADVTRALLEDASALPADGEQAPSWLLEGLIVSPRRDVIYRMAVSFVWRNLVLVLIPCVVVLAWCALPFPTTPSKIDWPEWPPVWPRQSDGLHVMIPKGEGSRDINFWFFVFVYYGLYNAIGLFWITKMFNLFSVNWWPKRVGGIVSYVLFWAVSEMAGIAIYLSAADGGWETYTLTWVLLTFVTMSGPLFIAMHRMRMVASKGRRYSLTQTQITFSGNEQLPRRPMLPSSYVRFLWFSLVMFIGLLAFGAGDWYAYIYLTSGPHHKSTDALLYVYTWVATVHILDLATAWVLNAKIKSYPLVWVFKLYYQMTLMVYVRNLYARLHTPAEFAIIQGASSFVMTTLNPLLMTTYAHRIMCFFSQSRNGYDEHKKNMARSFYVKCLANNITMISFLGWMAILHFGPNRRVYPYFMLDSDVDAGFTFQLTFYASCAVWLAEMLSALLSRQIMLHFFHIHVTQEAVIDLVRYPDITPAAVAVSTHVLQNMLFSILKLEFS